jgi:hypothetical protein
VADPRGSQPDLPAAAAAAMMKALRPLPEERFASARELGRAVVS